MAKAVHLALLSTLLLLIFSVPARAQDWQFQPRINAGFLSYEFEEEALAESSRTVA